MPDFFECYRRSLRMINCLLLLLSGISFPLNRITVCESGVCFVFLRYVLRSSEVRISFLFIRGQKILFLPSGLRSAIVTNIVNGKPKELVFRIFSRKYGPMPLPERRTLHPQKARALCCPSRIKSPSTGSSAESIN